MGELLVDFFRHMAALRWTTDLLTITQTPPGRYTKTQHIRESEQVTRGRRVFAG